MATSGNDGKQPELHSFGRRMLGLFEERASVLGGGLRIDLGALFRLGLGRVRFGRILLRWIWIWWGLIFSHHGYPSQNAVKYSCHFYKWCAYLN
ncbi:MAG: hypothetical protein OEQ29_14480 [Alphaproteobacteria bacterium]|nr:hypothetical protein [Alphaproteobacteria bacterium]